VTAVPEPDGGGLDAGARGVAVLDSAAVDAGPLDAESRGLQLVTAHIELSANAIDDALMTATCIADSSG
jgi:hypothetical protein